MGFYINPEGMTKENWLAVWGKLLEEAPTQVELFDEGGTEHYAVCLVDNGHFTAAGIVWSEQELEDFKYPDGRWKQWYAVPKEHIFHVNPQLKEFLERNNV